MNENWYDDPANVLALARWMVTEGNRHMHFSDRAETVAFMLKNPRHYDNGWQEYQASLDPKEPTLSEQAEKMYGPGLHVEMAQRIEALEKEREL